MNGTNLVFGSDGYSQTFHDSHGDLQVMSDGTYKFVAQANDVYNDGGTVSFNYTVTDGDGDTSTAQGAFNVTDTVTPVTVSLSASAVNEDAARTTCSRRRCRTPRRRHHDHHRPGRHQHCGWPDRWHAGVASNNGEDVYSDASSLTAAITGASGGDFEHLVSAPGRRRRGQRHEHDVTVNLSASTVDEGAGANYVFTATLSNASHGVTTITRPGRHQHCRWPDRRHAGAGVEQGRGRLQRRQQPDRGHHRRRAATSSRSM